MSTDMIIITDTGIMITGITIITMNEAGDMI